MTNGSHSGRPISSPSIRSAVACYEEGRLDEAAQACDAILRADSGHFEALRLLGLVKLATRDAKEAARLLTLALKQRPRSPDAVLSLGNALQMTGDHAGAVVQYDRALALKPGFVVALNNRGNALRALGRHHEALASYDSALAQHFEYPEALNNRGAVLLDLGCAEDALTSFQQAIALKTDFLEAYFNRANAFAALGRHQRALAGYDEALRLYPRYGAAHACKSAILMILQRYDEALVAAKAAIEIDPAHVDALINCGAASQHLGHFDEAIAAYDSALSVSPRAVAALRNRAAAMAALGRHREALADYDQLLAITPGDADAAAGRGEALRALGQHPEALAAFEQALVLNPVQPLALGGSAFTALNLCDWDRAERLGAELMRRVEAGMAVSPFILLNLCDSSRLHATGAKNFVRDQIKTPSQRFRHDASRHDDRIRIAYLSCDFCQHPIGLLTAELFERHDRSRFEIVGISFGPDDGSALRARLARSFDAFHDVRAVGSREVAKLIHDLRTDIAVDLTGYTAGCRPEILAWRPAPVAVNYLGYPGTMAASFIDYIIADPIVLPLTEQPFYTEKFVHLPDSYQVNSRRSGADETPTRAAAGLPETGFVFCCFNNAFKIGRPIFDIWMRLLASVEGSVLWLLAPHDVARNHLRNAATSRGIDPDRLVFAAREPLAVHLARHRLADLVLDTLPYNAHTTASDALWAGVPVITCPGHAFASRVGASLMMSAGMSDLVAPDLAAYEALALWLATEPQALAECRQRLEQQHATAPLFAVDRQVDDLEAAFAHMHTLWHSGKAPQAFAVPPIP
jgi:protein O-GlcNAc transferase